MSDLPSIYAVILTIVLVICFIVTGAPIQTEYGDEIRLPTLLYNKTSTHKNSTSLKANDFDNDFSTPEGMEAALALLHRSDTFPPHTSGGTFFGDPRLRMQWVVWISVRSWVAYKTFTTDKCRFVADQLPDFSDDNFFYKNDYFRYEEAMFNLELRNLLFPETSRGDLKSMLGTPYLTKLDSRFFQMPLKSLCSMSPDDKKKAGETTEASRFEDKVINKVASKDNEVIPSLSERFDRFQAWIASGKSASEFQHDLNQ
uniref:Membrane-associated protein n=1 Tax=Panagrellus redivivus TaxID=6233 RepID=A0A7E4VZX9_PANRE